MIRDCSTYEHNRQGLGIAPAVIAGIIAAVVKLAPMVASWFGSGNKDNDPWNRFSAEEKREYVRQGILVAIDQYKAGNVSSIDEAMAVIIAQVETNETYATWKSAQSNAEYANMINQAQIAADQQQAGFGASLGIIILGVVLSVAGFGAYRIVQRRRQHKLLTAKKLQ